MLLDVLAVLVGLFTLCLVMNVIRMVVEAVRGKIKLKNDAFTISEGATSCDSQIANIDENQRLYESLNEWESDLADLWEGVLEIEFTYESRKGRERRRVSLYKVRKNSRGNVYLYGHCERANKNRSFNIDYITTKILHKSKRYDVDDFLCDFLGIDFEAIA